MCISFWVLFFVIGFYFTALAQFELPSLKKVYLNQEDGLLANPWHIVLFPEDTLQFVVDSGDFAIFIEDAVSFLKIKEADLKIHINSSTADSVSIKYVVRAIDTDVKTTYSIYSISNDSWPLAPPRIIIEVN